ncbi:hypothetical protein GUITHDRAFT_150714 [Guillardia theta CCMP2712]|uniref:Uncharacterized protein n=1 Tax=Guillardia theta (strain CCMP2712) TaxID=905079 RepID=L1JVR0_GUITC|nr:hypothetical protein GUITHDRAFT_150714 [Guillardia theta CCMP2712]EKX52188.1 hypothetical protein GUITHDRAFT_150714 [Guillardia theta CCMP2712]|eukprot:XP_005839168.1 hypothetical protein GUITHDRAFT_150714 [Guillardia theta CCMP2712]
MVSSRQLQRVANVARIASVANGGFMGGMKSAMEHEPIAVYSIVLGVVGLGIAYVAPQIWPLERQIREQQYVMRGNASNRVTDY